VLNYETKWMTCNDIVRATYDATVAMARLRAKHGLIPEESARELEALVNQTRQLMAEIECVLALDDTEQLQDTLRTLKPKIDAVNHAGSWKSDLSFSDRKCNWQAVDSMSDGNLRGAQGLWGSLRSWWNRQQDASRHAAKVSPMHVSCYWFRPPPI
jgi:hypothetical protein